MLKYVALLLYLTVSFNTPGGQVDEMTMKAIYIERFTRFIDWPDKVNDDFFRIQVIGDKKLAKKFREIYKRLKIKNKTVLIHEYDDTYNPDFRPHIVYLANKNKVAEVLKSINKKPVLLISQGPDASENGAMISLYTKKTKLKFEINETTINQTPLYVSYRLKKAAERIIKTESHAKQ